MAEQRLAMPDRADPSHTGDMLMVMRLSHETARRHFLFSGWDG